MRPSTALRQKNRILHLRRSARRTTTQWRRTLTYWLGAILVGVVAVAFAGTADWAARARGRLLHWDPYVMLVVVPAGLALSTWLTRRFFAGAQGSGIPQTIATLHIENFSIVNRVLSLRIAFAKIILTCFGLLVGASIGREGPTVQVGAATGCHVRDAKQPRKAVHDRGTNLHRRALAADGCANEQAKTGEDDLGEGDAQRENTINDREVLDMQCGDGLGDTTALRTCKKATGEPG